MKNLLSLWAVPKASSHLQTIHLQDVYKRQGYVVDYFETTFITWPVFNVADIYVVAGTILLAFMFLFVIKDDNKK